MLFTVDDLVLGTGTAVLFLFTSDADLFFADAVLNARKFGLDLERRVVTFPSGLVRMLDV